MLHKRWLVGHTHLVDLGALFDEVSTDLHVVTTCGTVERTAIAGTRCK